MNEEECVAAREIGPPVSESLERLTASRVNLDNAVSALFNCHQALLSEPAPTPDIGVDVRQHPGSSELASRISSEADNIDEQASRLFAFIKRSEVAA